jgi:hypothetical protein
MVRLFRCATATAQALGQKFWDGPENCRPLHGPNFQRFTASRSCTAKSFNAQRNYLRQDSCWWIRHPKPWLTHRLFRGPKPLPIRFLSAGLAAMASSLLRASPLSLLSRLKPRPLASHLRGLVPLTTAASASRAPPPLRTLAAVAADARSERLQPLQWPQRDTLCGELGADDSGRRVRLCGWVALRRTHAGLTFLTLRDRSGMVQVSSLCDCIGGTIFCCPEAGCRLADGVLCGNLTVKI